MKTLYTAEAVVEGGRGGAESSAVATPMGPATQAMGTD
jgi:hypothetical protein